MITLNIEKRVLPSKRGAKGEKGAKVKSLETLRNEGKIPAVYYGRKEKSTPILISKIEFSKIWKQAGESSIVSLKGEGQEHDALIKDVDLDPVSSAFRHVDFYVVEKGKKLQVNIPLTFVGVSTAVKDLGGILIKVVHELKIEAIPKDLPHTIEVDISSLVAFDSRITAKDLKLSSGVSLAIGLDEVIASVAQPVEEKEEEVVPVDLSQIEISEKKGKEVKEGEEAEAGTPAKDDKGPKKEAKDAKAS